MVSSGVDSNEDVYPILVDASGRPYVTLDDGAGNTQPAGDDHARPIFVKVTDGTRYIHLDASNRVYCRVDVLRPDGANMMPSGDVTARKIFVKPTDGTNDFLTDTDDDNIASGQIPQLVINLNYVWDAGNTKWVRMTQP